MSCLSLKSATAPPTSLLSIQMKLPFVLKTEKHFSPWGLNCGGYSSECLGQAQRVPDLRSWVTECSGVPEHILYVCVCQMQAPLQCGVQGPLSRVQAYCLGRFGPPHTSLLTVSAALSLILQIFLISLSSPLHTALCSSLRFSSFPFFLPFLFLSSFFHWNFFFFK